MRHNLLFLAILFSGKAYCYPPEIIRGSLDYISAENLKKCSLIPGSYVESVAQFEKSYLELKSLVHQEITPENTSRILALQLEIKKLSQLLNALAAPEWNNELFRIQISWWIPHSSFFSDPSKDKKFDINPNRLSDFTIDSEEYMGRPSLDAGWLVSGDLGSSGSPLIQFNTTAEVTLLELCQLVKTLEVDVTINYELQLGKYMLPGERKLKLVYGDWNL